MNEERTVIQRSLWPDILRGIVASAIGILVFMIADHHFHHRAAWYFEGTFALTSAPYYQELNWFFITLPYVIGWVVVGLLAGAGRMTMLRFPLMRFVIGFGVYGLINHAYTAVIHAGMAMLHMPVLLPGILAFTVSAGVDWAYRHRCVGDFTLPEREPKQPSAT